MLLPALIDSSQMARCWMPQFPLLYKTAACLSFFVFIKTAALLTCFGKHSRFCDEGEETMPFREALLIYTSKQSPKGWCPPLPKPPLTQIEGMQSKVWPTKFGFFLLALSLYWEFLRQIVSAELRALKPGGKDSWTWAVISRCSLAYSDFESIYNHD